MQAVPHQPPTIRRQLLNYIIFGGALLFLLFSITLGWLTTSKTSVMTVTNAQQVARALAQQSVLALLTESEENAEVALQQVMNFPDVTGAGLINLQNQVISWRGDPYAAKYFQDMELIAQSKENHLFEDNSAWYVASLVVLEGANADEQQLELMDQTAENLGYALVSFSKQRLYDFSKQVILIIVFTGFIALITLTLSIDGVIQRLTSPLNTLSKAMVHSQRTGEHTYSKIQGSREVQQIAESYNAMMATLDSQEEKLRNHRDQLEAQVKIRTKELTVARDTALNSSRYKSEFLANMTHELRTPIQAIMGYIDLVKEELEDEGLYHLQQDLDKVTRNSERLLSMISSVLDLAKIEAGRMELKLRSVYLEELLKDVQDTILPLLPMGNNHFQLYKPEHNLQVRVDTEKLHQVLVNLISNACKFTENGNITLKVEHDQNELRFSVQDTGIGIAEDKLQVIFQQFSQVDGSQTRKFDGTGLGLAISKEFCQLMGAELSVESKLGEGSTFTVVLPISM